MKKELLRSAIALKDVNRIRSYVKNRTDLGDGFFYTLTLGRRKYFSQGMEKY